MDAFMNRVRAEALRTGNLAADNRMGIVSTPNLGGGPLFTAKVNIMPEGGDPDLDQPQAETGWLPILTPWAGDGWGMFCPPSEGTQVMVAHIEGDPGAGVILGSVFDLNHAAPMVPPGEFWLIHKTGAFIKLTNEGTVTIQDKDGSAILLDGTGTAKLTAGSINLGSSGQALHKLVTDAFVEFFNAHSHASNGAPPSEPMTSAHLTSTVNAG